jgi:hypothetical protein
MKAHPGNNAGKPKAFQYKASDLSDYAIANA